MWESPNNRVAQHGPYLILHYFRDTVVGATHRMCKALALSILVNELNKSIVNRVLTLFHSARPGWGRQGSTLEQRRLQALGTHRRQRIGGEGRDVEKYDRRGAKIMPGGEIAQGEEFFAQSTIFPPLANFSFTPLVLIFSVCCRVRSIISTSSAWNSSPVDVRCCLSPLPMTKIQDLAAAAGSSRDK